MTVPTLDDVWQSLFSLATTVCDRIETDSPDVVIVLHRSGAVVWHAVCTVWAATRTRPFPPVVEILLGKNLADPLAEGSLLVEWEYEEPKCVGIMLARVVGQEAWQKVLYARLQAALGEKLPTNVLVVDDVVADGCTAVTVLGLLWAMFPQTRTCLYAGLPFTWRVVVGDHWLKTHYPAVAEQMAANWERDKSELFAARARWILPGCFWPPLLSGLACGAEPLSSVPLSPPLPYSEYLARYIAPAQWLECSAWVRATVESVMTAYLAARKASPSSPRPTWSARRYALSADEQIWAQVWLREWTTLDEFVQYCRASIDELQSILADLVAEGEFVCRTVDGVVQYGRKLQRAIVTADAWFDRYWGWLQQEIVEERPIVTPFAVEYARSAPEQAGGPMLIPVADGHGTPVCGRLLLYNVEVDGIEMPDSIYYCCRSESDASVTVECTHEFEGATEVYSIWHTANLDFVPDPAVTDAEKGLRLAELAAASLTPETVAQGTDGIQYLINAIAAGVETRLTPHYRDALLRLAGGALDLSTARRRLLDAKGLSERAAPDAVLVGRLP